MASGFLYRSGPWELASFGTTASTAIAVLDSLKTSSGLVLPGTAGAKVSGVALGSKLVGDSATTAIQVLLTGAGRTKFFAETKAGSLASTERGAQFDLSGSSGAQGFDANTTTNGDIFIHTVISTGSSGQALIKFADPDTLTST